MIQETGKQETDSAQGLRPRGDWPGERLVIHRVGTSALETEETGRKKQEGDRTGRKKRIS